MPLVRRAHWHHSLSTEDARDVVQDAALPDLERYEMFHERAWQPLPS